MQVLQSANEALKLGLSQLGLQPTAEILEFKSRDRWVISYEQDPAFPDLGRNLIKLERWLKQHLGTKNLDIICETREDKNRRNVRTGRGPTMVNARGVESLD